MTVPGTSSSYPASSATSATLSGIMVPTEPRETIDQVVLRRWLLLLPTFLLLDTSTHPAPSGLLSWQLGLHSLISLMLALHAQDQLEWDTMNAASRALAECWSISLCWNGMEAAKGVVQSAGGRLKAVLDKDDPTRYKGRLLYPVEG
ncbi:hypothetical protein DACRYDRAFT_19572 [Dacryopinax primogenitus]|uniref:Uncharacterized protein n=1 Tax=Dacryopinax primogenitus (strain DJM 731) TaxID=1858805 RepID=M5GFK5_DACPD|nr:uncharacterized protein DACRYDRAFT_19572 [Dacryopinax primogenitus]EJU06402.1 hypothetical protein DACRYDRAFT_19572 [Dacryopinax primogenitus]